MEANSLDSDNVFQECFLAEFEIAERQLLALAQLVPAEKYSWRPNDGTRSVSEIFLQIVAGNVFILETIGHGAPPEIYPDVSSEGEERLWEFLKQNDEFQQNLQEKDRIFEMLNMSLQAVRESLSETESGQRTQRIIRRAYMRLLARCHEYLGQMMAYVRALGMGVPWEDSRAD